MSKSWIDRLQPEIELISPEGESFAALWRGDEETGEKRLGKHAFPGINLDFIQDMGMQSPLYPMEIIFAGKDNDRESRRFVEALYEKGIWKVHHPVDGLLELIVVSYKRPKNAVENGNVTIVEVEFIKPLEELDPTGDAASGVQEAADNLRQSGMKRFISFVQRRAKDVVTIKNAIKRGINAVLSGVAFVNEKIRNINATIGRLLSDEILDLESIASCFFRIIEAPSMLHDTVNQKIEAIQNIGKKIWDDIEKSFNGQNVTEEYLCGTGEFMIDAIIAEMAERIIENPPQTRREALEILNEYIAFINEYISVFESMAAETSENDIERQYTAGGESWEALATLNAAVINYLMNALFDLQIERVIELETPMSPMSIVIEEMGATNNNVDELYNAFCRWNNLHGRDMLLLDRGRMVVIYG